MVHQVKLVPKEHLDIKDLLDLLDFLVCEAFLDLQEIKEEEEILVYLVRKGL